MPVVNVLRDNQGRLVSGALNPSGRPAMPEGLRARAQAASPRALERIIGLLESDDERIALKAAELILDRGYGKPVASIEARIEQFDTARAHLDALKQLVSVARDRPAVRVVTGKAEVVPTSRDQ